MEITNYGVTRLLKEAASGNELATRTKKYDRLVRRIA